MCCCWVRFCEHYAGEQGFLMKVTSDVVAHIFNFINKDNRNDKHTIKHGFAQIVLYKI